MTSLSGGRSLRHALLEQRRTVIRPTLALASSTGVPSAFSAQSAVAPAPAAGIAAKARTSSPSTTMFW